MTNMKLEIGFGDLRRGGARPVAFPVRCFRHSSIYINVNRGISSPRDLAGKVKRLVTCEDIFVPQLLDT